jgi:hypothetical protein
MLLVSAGVPDNCNLGYFRISLLSHVGGWTVFSATITPA